MVAATQWLASHCQVLPTIASHPPPPFFKTRAEDGGRERSMAFKAIQAYSRQFKRFSCAIFFLKWQ
jgi:hypothetical protein